MTMSIFCKALEQFLQIKHNNSSDSKEKKKFLFIKERFELIHAGQNPRINRNLYSVPHQ